MGLQHSHTTIRRLSNQYIICCYVKNTHNSLNLHRWQIFTIFFCFLNISYYLFLQDILSQELYGTRPNLKTINLSKEVIMIRMADCDINNVTCRRVWQFLVKFAWRVKQSFLSFTDKHFKLMLSR